MFPNGSKYHSILVSEVAILDAKPITKTVLAEYVLRDLACCFG